MCVIVGFRLARYLKGCYPHCKTFNSPVSTSLRAGQELIIIHGYHFSACQLATVWMGRLMCIILQLPLDLCPHSLLRTTLFHQQDGHHSDYFPGYGFTQVSSNIISELNCASSLIQANDNFFYICLRQVNRRKQIDKDIIVGPFSFILIYTACSR